MHIRVNKHTHIRKPVVKYAALSTGTVSHVWYDDESESIKTAKRRNHIRVSIPAIAAQLHPELRTGR
jgi:hypothetical protein